MELSAGRSLKELYFTCIDLDVSARRQFLDRECASDPHVRSRVEELLAVHETTDPLIDEGLAPFPSSLFDEDYGEGDLIGKYMVLRRIGAGGMGVVYLATRPDLKAPPVAIKIVKKGMDTEEILRRFQSEREILSALENKASIVNFKDAGVAASGVPFFVMEYVDGLPIDAYCREKKLTLNDILKLFLNVCEAVGEAHLKTVVHRDLKPGNILIGRENGKPKLLDFGIAAMLSEKPRTLSVSIVREFGMMSPEYASPEQTRGAAPDMRMDVYSMGVILYRLITGVHPQCVDGTGIEEMLRRIREDEPVTPSQAGGAQNSMPADGELRHDLDNILLKALHKDPERRYRSIEQFSGDIENYLTGMPVTARPDTFGYEARKFVKRNRRGVVVSAAALLLIMVATGVITWQIQVANAQRARSTELRGQLSDLTNWLVSDFHGVIEKLSGATEARRMLATRALQSLNAAAKEAEGDREIRVRSARAYRVLGDVLGLPDDANVGDRRGAIDSYRKALKLVSDADSGKDVELQRERAVLHERLGRTLVMTGDTKEAYEHDLTALKLLRQLIQAGKDDHVTRRSLASCYLLLGKYQERQGDKDGAMAEYLKAMAEFDRLSQDHIDDGEAERDLSVVYSSIGDVNQKLGKMIEAQTFFERSMRIRERAFGRKRNNREAARDLSTIYDRLAALYADTDRIAGAFEYEKKTLAIDERLYDADRTNADAERDVANDYVSLGDMLSQMGQPRQALADDLTAFEMRKDLHARTPDDTDIAAEYGDSALFVGVAKATLGDATADADLKTGRDIGAGLHAGAPANAVYHDFFAKALLMSGQAMEKLRRRSEALEYYKQSVALFRELREAQKDNFEADAHLKQAEEGERRLSRVLAPQSH